METSQSVEQKLEERRRQRIKNIAFWVMIIIVIALAIYVLFYIKSESYECMNNPLVYGVKNIEENNKGFTCSCFSQSMNSKIFVTKDNMSLL